MARARRMGSSGATCCSVQRAGAREWRWHKLSTQLLRRPGVSTARRRAWEIGEQCGDWGREATERCTSEHMIPRTCRMSAAANVRQLVGSQHLQQHQRATAWCEQVGMQRIPSNQQQQRTWPPHERDWKKEDHRTKPCKESLRRLELRAFASPYPRTLPFRCHPVLSALVRRKDN